MTTSRLETFADGVFAIAATLLILNVDAQVGAAHTDLGARLLHIWPSYVAYAVSFLTIGIIWVNHHTVMSQVARARCFTWPRARCSAGLGGAVLDQVERESQSLHGGVQAARARRG